MEQSNVSIVFVLLVDILRKLLGMSSARFDVMNHPAQVELYILLAVS